MNWDEGYTFKVYATEVDPVTWKDIDKIELTSADIKRSDSELRQSADIDCRNYDNERDIWIRIWMDASQRGEATHNAIFTGTTTPTARNIDGLLISRSMACYSVLLPAQEVLLPRGWYAPARSYGTDIIKTLLKVGPAPIIIEGTEADLEETRLKTAIIAEQNENRLSMADKILNVIGWELVIDGHGRIIIKKPSSTPVVSYNSMTNDVIQVKLTENKDWYGLPNVFRATVDDVSAVAKDEDPNSILSIVNRGREIWMEETDCDLNENESLSAYAMRRLKEEQRFSTVLDYDVRFDPRVNVGDLVEISYPAQNLNGVYYISEQSISLEKTVSVSEEAISI